MSLNRDSVQSSFVSQKSYPKTAFDSILILTDKATFIEDFRVYQSSKGFLADNGHADLQQAGLLIFGQEPKAKTVIVAKTDPANTDAGALSVRIVELDETLSTDFFVCAVVSDHSDEQLIELAKYMETQQQMLVLSDSSDNALTTEQTDLGAKVKALGLRHTSVWWHKTKRLDLAFVARFLGEKIGLVSAKHLVLASVDSANLSVSALANIFGKNINVYDTERKKYTFTKQGSTASNENIKTVAGELFIAVSCIEQLYELQLNNSVLSFNSKDLKKVRAGILKQISKAKEQLIIAEDSNGEPSYLLTLTPIRTESKLEIDIKYLDAGQIKFIDLKFTAFQDETQFNIERGE